MFYCDKHIKALFKNVTNLQSFTSQIHELSHVIGMHHTMVRPDRDNHIEVLYQNIPETSHINFNMVTGPMWETYGTVYDFASIMQYEAWVKTHFLYTNS